MPLEELAVPLAVAVEAGRFFWGVAAGGFRARMHPLILEAKVGSAVAADQDT